jgi:hypothetical protein
MMSEEGKKIVTKNLKRDSVLKSGGYSFLRLGIAPACHGCTTGSFCEDYDGKKCLAVVRFQNEMEEEIMALNHIREIDRLLVRRLVKYAAFLFITDEWISNTSPYTIEDGKLDLQPLVKNRIEQERLLIRLSNQLCLNPEARARVGLNIAQTYSLAQQFQELNRNEEE